MGGKKKVGKPCEGCVVMAMLLRWVRSTRRDYTSDERLTMLIELRKLLGKGNDEPV